jgi:hypothetical protein
MELFTLENNIVIPSTHALLTEPFKTIWEQDNSRQHVEAIKIFTYIEFVCSPKKSNPFFDIHEADRARDVRKEVWGDPDYKPDNYLIIMEGVYKYNELLKIVSPSMRLYLAAIKALNEVTSFLNTVNLKERTVAGGAVIKPADITRAFKELPDMKKTVETLRTSVHQELEEASKTRGSREVGDYER